MFEKIVLENLRKCGFDVSSGKSIGAAISGGADSVSLLVCLANLSRKFSFPIKVITVNHNIRSTEESGGDANFVRDLCERLKKNGVCIDFFEKIFPAGFIADFAEKSGSGIEACARNFRYAALEDFAQREGVGFICLAHNRNDQIETVLMRFLQGSGASGMCGIKMVRGKYIRPLLSVSRQEIENYLRGKNFSWRTDSTNFDNNYLRNKIRNVLVPFLNENFYGFENALMSGVSKSELDADFFENLLNGKDFKWKNCSSNINSKGDSSGKSENEVFLPRNFFESVPDAVKIRCIFNGFNYFFENFYTDVETFESRLPFKVVQEFISMLSAEKSECSVCWKNVEICATRESISIKKRKILATESGFFAIIDKDGSFDFPFGKIDCKSSGGIAKAVFLCDESFFEINNLRLPFCVRSFCSGDKIEASDGTMKSVVDILSGWRVRSDLRKLIPVVQELDVPAQPVIGLVGSVMGYENWILRGF